MYSEPSAQLSRSLKDSPRQSGVQGGTFSLVYPYWRLEIGTSGQRTVLPCAPPGRYAYIPTYFYAYIPTYFYTTPPTPRAYATWRRPSYATWRRPSSASHSSITPCPKLGNRGRPQIQATLLQATSCGRVCVGRGGGEGGRWGRMGGGEVGSLQRHGLIWRRMRERCCV